MRQLFRFLHSRQISQASWQAKTSSLHSAHSAQEGMRIVVAVAGDCVCVSCVSIKKCYVSFFVSDTLAYTGTNGSPPGNQVR